MEERKSAYEPARTPRVLQIPIANPYYPVVRDRFGEPGRVEQRKYLIYGVKK